MNPIVWKGKNPSVTFLVFLGAKKGVTLVFPVPISSLTNLNILEVDTITDSMIVDVVSIGSWSCLWLIRGFLFPSRIPYFWGIDEQKVISRDWGGIRFCWVLMLLPKHRAQQT